MRGLTINNQQRADVCEHHLCLRTLIIICRCDCLQALYMHASSAFIFHANYCMQRFLNALDFDTGLVAVDVELIEAASVFDVDGNCFIHDELFSILYSF